MYPRAHLFGCSTSGEICDDRVFDGTLVATAIYFEKTEIMGAQILLDTIPSSIEAGAMRARSIKQEGLRHVFVLSDGLNINGSELVAGLTQSLPGDVTITGGLAGNADRFEETYVFWDDLPSQKRLAILGIYGKNLKIGYGSVGGWDPFGPERLIAK